MTIAPIAGFTRRTLLLGGIVVCVIALAFGIGNAVAADPKLDLADLALEKAAALLEASESGVVSDKQQKRFDRAVARALADIESAREQIAEAKDTVDNP